MSIATIKSQIKADLDSLVPATLGEVQEDDFKTSIFDRDFGKFPVAILTTPEVAGDYLTNRENMRIYHFNIVVIQKQENVAGVADIETLIEVLLNKFDNDPTLAGAASGGVEPSSSAPEAIVSRAKTYIAFVISIKIHESVTLTFS